MSIGQLAASIATIDGTCHRAYGPVPNMTWILTRSGLPVYKIGLNDAGSVENAMTHFMTLLSVGAGVTGCSLPGGVDGLSQ